jgi:protein-S-isoprenylcysteine O-methyltransferase Ste14
LTTWVGFIAVILIIIRNIFLGAQPVHPHSIMTMSDPWGIVGLVLVLLGIYTRSWAAGIIHKTQTLTTVGPYSLMRHPLYVGSFLIALGFLTIIGDVWNFVIILGLLVPLHTRKAMREERNLSKKYGEQWTAFAARTGPFYPKKSPVGTLSPWSFPQWFHNKEFGALLTGMAGLVVMELWHKYPEVVSHIRTAIR